MLPYGHPFLGVADRAPFRDALALDFDIAEAGSIARSPGNAKAVAPGLRDLPRLLPVVNLVRPPGFSTDDDAQTVGVSFVRGLGDAASAAS